MNDVAEQKRTFGINRKDYAIPSDIEDKRTVFFLAGAMLSGDAQSDESVIQAGVEGFKDPQLMAEKVLVSALIGAQNRYNFLYKLGMASDAKEKIEMYLRYADKFLGKVATLAESIARIKCDRTQKIIVERINIENGAQAIVGNVSNG
jgi:hypothetical protein